MTASASKNYDPLYNVNKQTAASVIGTLTIPIYQGGGEYSAIRQSKETLGQQRLNLDVNRDQARATVVQSWGQLDAAKAQIEATTAQVNAAEIALNGVREEARVGQRTTLDVLNAQQELVNARVALVTAQHDRVVASYTLLAAVGGLSMQRLGLNVTDLRSAGALSAGARCLDRRAHARRPDRRLAADSAARSCPQLRLAFDFRHDILARYVA